MKNSQNGKQNPAKSRRQSPDTVIQQVSKQCRLYVGLSQRLMARFLDVGLKRGGYAMRQRPWSMRFFFLISTILVWEDMRVNCWIQAPLTYLQSSHNHPTFISAYITSSQFSLLAALAHHLWSRWSTHIIFSTNNRSFLPVCFPSSLEPIPGFPPSTTH